MCNQTMTNVTIITQFILLGFPMPKWLCTSLFSFFLLLYVFIICGNIMIIMVVRNEPKLHIPMYFFIANFSFLEILYTTVTVPRMIRDIIVEDRSINFSSCIAQFYCFMVCGGNEHCLLAILAYDRFIAICHPFQYTVIMKPKYCMQLIAGAWLLCFLAPVSTAFSLYKTEFCSDSINHFFCDIAPILQIACRTKTEIGIVFYTTASVIILCCLFMICLSYGFILYTVLHIKSHQGRSNAFSTCASHLTVVTIFYSSCIFMYIRPGSHTFFLVDKIVSLAYVLIVPLLNPIIYTFRNKAMNAAIGKYVKMSFINMC